MSDNIGNCALIDEAQSTQDGDVNVEGAGDGGCSQQPTFAKAARKRRADRRYQRERAGEDKHENGGEKVDHGSGGIVRLRAA